MYGRAAPREHLATRPGQDVWPRSRPTEDDVEAAGSSRAMSGHDLSQNGFVVVVVLDVLGVLGVVVIVVVVVTECI